MSGERSLWERLGIGAPLVWVIFVAAVGVAFNLGQRFTEGDHLDRSAREAMSGLRQEVIATRQELNAAREAATREITTTRDAVARMVVELAAQTTVTNVLRERMTEYSRLDRLQAQQEVTIAQGRLDMLALRDELRVMDRDTREQLQRLRSELLPLIQRQRGEVPAEGASNIGRCWVIPTGLLVCDS